MPDFQPYWILIAGLILLYVFALMFVSWRPSRRGGSNGTWLGPGGTQHLLGPGGTRQMFGYEGFEDSGKPIFYMFGVDWCPHCVSAKPTFEKLKETIGDLVKIVFVNPEKNPAEAKGFQIDGYPTFYLVKNGQQIKYSGDRNKKEMEIWLQSQIAA